MLKRLLWLLLLVGQISGAESIKSIDSIVAVVNDGVITANELNEQTRVLRSQLQAKKMKLPPESVLKKQVLQHLIDVKIQLQLAQRNNIDVDSTDLDSAIKKIAKNNQYTVSQLRREIGKTGLSWNAYRENIKTEIILTRLQQKAIGKQVTVSPEQVSAYINNSQQDKSSNKQFHLKNILVPLPESPSSEEVAKAKQEASKLVEKINGGADFSQIALAESRDEYALEGGDLGFRNLASLPELFAKKVVRMKPGQIAGPLRAGNGFHIIKLLAVKDNKKKRLVKLTKVRHILVKQDASMTEQEAQKQVRNLYQLLVQGKSFADMAKKYSLDPGSASKGGALGWVHPGELVPEFEKAMNKLPLNKISKPVKSQFGWHIIQVLQRKRVDDSKTYEKQKVSRLLYQRKFTEAVQSWQQQLRTEAYVKIVDKQLTV